MKNWAVLHRRSANKLGWGYNMQIKTYICLKCMKNSYQMIKLGTGYKPTEKDISRRPDLIQVGGEYLKCSCGLIHTWYTLVEITDFIDDDKLRKLFKLERDQIQHGGET